MLTPGGSDEILMLFVILFLSLGLSGSLCSCGKFILQQTSGKLLGKVQINNFFHNNSPQCCIKVTCNFCTNGRVIKNVMGS